MQEKNLYLLALQYNDKSYFDHKLILGLLQNVIF